MLPRNPSNHPFQKTRWSLVLTLNNGTDEKQARRALEELCTIYWPPLYSYARRSGLRPADAEDATQSFFASVLDKRFFASADSTTGKMRSYLLGCFHNHLVNLHHYNKTLKRGGAFQFVPISEGEAEALHRANEMNQSSPENEFDKRWALAMLEKALRKLEEEYTATGRGALFTALLPYINLAQMESAAKAADDPGQRPAKDDLPAATIPAVTGLSPAAVRQAGRRLRLRFRDEVTDMVRHTLENPTPSAIAEEIEALKRALRGK